LTLDRAIANTVKFTGLPIDVVVPMASTTPAALLGTAPSGTVEAAWDAEAHLLRVMSVRL
jgi:N-acetylglucosamine-6-phosphate deacetylase